MTKTKWEGSGRYFGRLKTSQLELNLTAHAFQKFADLHRHSFVRFPAHTNTHKHTRMKKCFIFNEWYYD